jgi:hypothetical protein
MAPEPKPGGVWLIYLDLRPLFFFAALLLAHGELDVLWPVARDKTSVSKAVDKTLCTEVVRVQ